MFALLNQYLYQYKQLNIPGLGNFSLVPQQAVADVAGRQIDAPGWQLQFTQDELPVTDDFYNWLAGQLQISATAAKEQFDQRVNAVQTQLHYHQKADWDGLGVLHLLDDGNIRFEPKAASITPFTPVKAAKIIREDADHQVLVGEKETTTQQMREQLQEDTRRRRKGCGAPVLLLAVTLLAAIFYLFNNGFTLRGTGNTTKVEATKPVDTYKLR